MAIESRRYRFTADEYHRMGEAGIFHEDDRVELIDGEILQMNPIGDPHAGAVNRLTALFTRVLDDLVVVAVQNPVHLSEHSEPQPDLSLLRYREDYYATRGPVPEDVLLLVEVADSTVEFDRRVKAPLYARSGILEYWLLDVGREHLVVFRDPSPEGYRSTQVLRRGETVSLVAFSDVAIPVADIVGRPAAE